MKAILVVSCILLCGAPKASPFPSGKVIDTVHCRADPSQSYALYIPLKAAGRLPVVYFFDSHGAGAFPIVKYKSLADAFGFILVGSNNSKNGTDWATTGRIWRSLSADSRERLNIDTSRMYTAGFSGGAKVAGYVALVDPGIKDVILNGAGLPDEVSTGDFTFGITAIAGTGDMNMSQLIAFDDDLDHTKTRHRLILFNGKHEWAPSETMQAAFEGLLLDGMAMGRLARNPELVARYAAESRQRLKQDLASGQLVQAGEDCTVSISYLKGLGQSVDWFIREADTLQGNLRYQAQKNAQEDLLNKEQGQKADFMHHFQQEDQAYWTTTIAGLRIGAKSPTGQGRMDERLLAFLSLTFYSVSNHLIEAGQNAPARYFVGLYELADPTNSEAWYFAAILDARENLTRKAEADLEKAVASGFRDRQRMKSQPEFLQLSPPINFSEIERLMR